DSPGKRPAARISDTPPARYWYCTIPLTEAVPIKPTGPVRRATWWTSADMTCSEAHATRIWRLSTKKQERYPTAYMRAAWFWSRLKDERRQNLPESLRIPRILAKFATVKKWLLLMYVTTLSCAALHAQQQDELRLLSSSHSRLNATTGRMINYRPVYEHHGSTLSADSGYIYNDDEGRQFFDAFSKVIITQPNGTVIYADKLHYVAETQLATLTNNVRMVDGSSVLTTNHLTYNMKSSVGTYTGGGRTVNTTDTITSRNAYYFDNTKDAYFRYDVIVRTPDVKIYTDTMRYNSVSKVTYFYGPTNIKGNDGENMYTERGEYNTETEQAWFDRNNLYTQGSKFLRGDSIYYDGVSGNGRAVQNVVFVDTADQYFSYGGEGVYNRADESITMTRTPLVMTVTRSDSTGADSLAVDSRTADSLAADPLGQPALRTDSLAADSLAPPTKEPGVVDTIYLTADTLFSRLIFLKDYVPRVFELDREGGELDEYDDEFTDDGYRDGLGGLDVLEPTDGGDTLTLERPSTLTGTPTDTAGVDSLAVPPTDSLQAPPTDSLQAPPTDSALL